jgi:hypothetical protein
VRTVARECENPRKFRRFHGCGGGCAEEARKDCGSEWAACSVPWLGRQSCFVSGWRGRGHQRPRSDRIGVPGRPRTAAPGLDSPSPEGPIRGPFLNTRLEEVLPTRTD